MTTRTRIGVVGVLGHDNFDQDLAATILSQAFDEIAAQRSGHDFVVVTVLVKRGVPRLACAEASRRDWRTVGVGFVSGNNGYISVGRRIITGPAWDEIIGRLQQEVDILIRVGGDAKVSRAVALVRRARKPVREFRLLFRLYPRLPAPSRSVAGVGFIFARTCNLNRSIVKKIMLPAGGDGSSSLPAHHMSVD